MALANAMPFSPMTSDIVVVEPYFLYKDDLHASPTTYR
jgi:hypothetical protein